MNHTPGPWLATSQAVYTASPDERSNHPDGRQAIAQIVEGWDNDTGRANARLIAAAPDLLAACEMALTHCKFPVGAQKAKVALQEAIARAKGSEQ